MKLQREVVPSFFLYGDEQLDEDLDTLHVEPIRERSLRYDWIIHPHVHPDHAQFIWIEEGGATFRIEQVEYVVQSSSLVVLPAGALHEIRFEPGTEGRVITAAVSFVEDVCQGDTRLVDISRKPGAYVVPSDTSAAAVIRHAFEQIQAESLWEETGRRSAIRGHMLTLLVSLLRVSDLPSLAQSLKQDRNFELVTRFRRGLEAHFRSEKALGFYAGKLGITAQRLNTACKARAGRTASEMLHDRILIEAKRALLYTEMSVAEVSYTLGYSDPAYFNRFFSQRVGLPPGEFRANSATTQRVAG
tara:strand:+ start:30110 stop:31015 length:906 start_codon:yes stop_codon:yes gene_type:complete